MTIGFPEFSPDIRQASPLFQITLFLHEQAGGIGTMAAETGIFFPGYGNIHPAMAGPARFGHNLGVAVRSLQHALPGMGRVHKRTGKCQDKDRDEYINGRFLHDQKKARLIIKDYGFRQYRDF